MKPKKWQDYLQVFFLSSGADSVKISRTCMSVMDLENISSINYAKSKDQRKIRRDQFKMGDLQNK